MGFREKQRVIYTSPLKVRPEPCALIHGVTDLDIQAVAPYSGTSPYSRASPRMPGVLPVLSEVIGEPIKRLT